ncbi:MAG: hypothetical protein R6W70_02385, partial [bacterium]
DKEEKDYGTDPYNKDTDGDGDDDLAEVVYGSDPTDPNDGIPDGIFYVVLPYNAPDDVERTLTFSTVVEAVDILIMFDDSGSMGPYINNLKKEAKAKIIQSISDEFSGNPDFAAFGLAMYGWNKNPYEIYQHITFNEDHVGNAIDKLNGDQNDEMAIPALYLSATGEEFNSTLKNCIPGFGGCDQNMINPAQYNIPKETCEGQLGSKGGACFRKKSMPIYIHISDESFMDCVPFTQDPGGWTECMWEQGSKTVDREMAIAAMNGIGAKFIGIDSSFEEQNDQLTDNPANKCKEDYDEFAARTGSLDADGNNFNSVVAYADGTGMSDEIANSILDLIEFIDMDVTTGSMAEDHEECDGISAAEFVKSSTTVEADPPGGVSGQDDTTFFSVTQGTTVTFDVRFYNDFCVNTSNSWQEYRAQVTVLGNGSYLSSRLVHVVVPKGHNR